MAKFLIVANWKMNPSDVRGALSLAQKIERDVSRFRGTEVVIAPPFPFLLPVRRIIKKVKLGAQNSFWEAAGPYTGEVSSRELKSIGVKYVIVGHSERRLHFGETDEMVNKKIKSLLEYGLVPILCIGEKERSGDDIPSIVGEQLRNALAGVKKGLLKNLIIAYEPVWAISTVPGSRPDTPDNAFRAKVFIRKILTDFSGSRRSADMVRIVYGGSVSSKNVLPFILEGKMEGALVGGASLESKEFTRVVELVSGVGSNLRPL